MSNGFNELNDLASQLREFKEMIEQEGENFDVDEVMREFGIDIKDLEFTEELIKFINGLKPEGSKCEVVIPTKNGYHLITKRFDVKTFSEIYPEIQIQKKNPTLLYLPNSLENNTI